MSKYNWVLSDNGPVIFDDAPGMQAESEKRDVRHVYFDCGSWLNGYVPSISGLCTLEDANEILDALNAKAEGKDAK